MRSTLSETWQFERGAAARNYLQTDISLAYKFSHTISHNIFKSILLKALAQISFNNHNREKSKEKNYVFDPFNFTALNVFFAVCVCTL